LCSIYRIAVYRITVYSAEEQSREESPMSPTATQSPLSVPVFQILLSCSDSVLHGYAIIQDIRERTGGRVDLTASTLYGALKRLLADGLVEERDAPSDAEDDDPRRRYYATSEAGRALLAAEAARLRQALEEAEAKGFAAVRGRRA
jgi:DNA-binding PadR family transcriptional regulator